MKAEPQPNSDVNRASGTDSDTGCWLRRLVRRRSHAKSQSPDLVLQIVKSRLQTRKLMLKREILLLRLRKVRLKTLIIFAKLVGLGLQLRYLVLEFLYCWRFFIHNLVVSYQNKHDGDEPPNAEVRQAAGRTAENSKK